ncbi:MAG: helix-turn-helix domain-containing protein [Rhodopseudomonas sp.]|nr:helix-turn-helix domain-containing protein [Rhodopseudomonas sp.]
MQDRSSAAAPGSPEKYPGCAFCIIFHTGICASGKVDKIGSANPAGGARVIQSSVHKALAGQMILHPRESSDDVMFICSGQAMSSIGLADGRRQIFEVLLPGDLVLWTALFEPMTGRLLEALDDTVYRKLKRSEFKMLLSEYPDFFATFMRFSAFQKNQCDQLALSLGRRNAAQRIARLILELAKRFAERGLISDGTFRFPLRQRHIADATGLTPVHTSKVLRHLRQDHIVEFKDRSLRILDMARLRQVAGP